MKVLFIVPDVESFPRPPAPTTPHVGVSYIMASLDAAGHETDIIDFRVSGEKERFPDVLKTFRPEMIGVTSYSIMYQEIYRLVAELKRNAGVPVVLGGPHVAAFGRRVLEESEADYAIKGEGELPMLDLCAGKPLDEISGAIWRKGISIVENPQGEPLRDLDALPFPAYQKSKLDRYLDKKLIIVSSRGCIRKCLYCTIRLTMGANFRSRTPESIVREISHWYNPPYNYRYFQFSDDCFSADIVRAKRICDLIIARKLDIGWELRNGIMVNRVDRELLEKMKLSGCRFIAWGIETIDPESMYSMKKGITVNQCRNAIEWSHKAGIMNSGFFMVGLPGDTFEKFKHNLVFAESLPLDEVRFYNTTPYPATELYDWVDKHARWLYPTDVYLNEHHANADDPVFETDDFPRSERLKALKIGQKFVIRLFLKREFGPILGKVFYLTYFIPFLRPTIMRIGAEVFGLWRKAFKLLRREPV